jgi:hypothetical protein
MAKHSQSKNHGTNSKKAQRVARAQARAKAWETLTPEQKTEVMENNKAEYDKSH